MRTFRKSVLIAMMVMVAAMSFANGNKPNVKVEKVGAKTIALYASHLGASKTQVQLRDENGLVLHQLVSDNNEKVSKRFDLNALPAGNYSIEIENETSFSSTTVQLTDLEATVNIADQVMIVKPVVRQNGNILDIIMPSEDTTSVSVIIYDCNFDQVYKETVDGTTELRRYDLSKLGKGGYTVKMISQGQKFIQFVALK
ncbi:MAG: hypothetical protein HEP71_09750 [Roseivirga sp.]|nr:hypothetical protein [Roseivirga sp.]